MKSIDIRNACCLVSAGLDEKLRQLPSGEKVEIIISKDIGEKMLLEVVKKEGCEILESKTEGKILRAIAKKESVSTNKECCKTNEEEKRAENCMVCGASLEYLETAVSVVCNYCRKEETGYVRCPLGHYVCDECHGKGAFDLISDTALTTEEKDPLSIAELLMAHPKVPFLGCEHALITTASLLAALKNDGTLEISNKQITEAMKRTQKQSMPPYCALTGVCGVPIGIGAAFSVILGAACPKDRESAITMHIVARTIDTIANDVGPMCCKSFVRTALGVAYNSAKEYFNVHLPIHREKISCFHSNKNHPNCRKEKCFYYPKTV